MVLKIIAFELVGGISLKSGEDTCDRPKGVLKQELSEIEVTTIFGFNNFRNN